jgi:hypothetical protein
LRIGEFERLDPRHDVSTIRATGEMLYFELAIPGLGIGFVIDGPCWRAGGAGVDINYIISARPRVHRSIGTKASVNRVITAITLDCVVRVITVNRVVCGSAPSVLDTSASWDR